MLRIRSLSAAGGQAGRQAGNGHGDIKLLHFLWAQINKIKIVNLMLEYNAEDRHTVHTVRTVLVMRQCRVRANSLSISFPSLHSHCSHS